MKIIFVFFLISLNLFSAKFDLNEYIVSNPKLDHYKFDNGFNVYILKNDYPKNVFSVRLVLNIGSLQEDDHEIGVAHLVEHMFLHGTKDYPNDSAKVYLESLGIKFGPGIAAFTSHDSTMFLINDIKIPAPTKDRNDLMEEIIHISSEWAFKVNFEQNSLDSERSVVEKEWEAYQSIPQRLSRFLIDKSFEGSHYLERHPFGDKDAGIDTVLNIKAGQVKKFTNKWYIPKNMALILAGDFKDEDIKFLKERIKYYFGNVKNPPNLAVIKEYSVPDNKKITVDLQEFDGLNYILFNLAYKRNVISQNTYQDLYMHMINNLYNKISRFRLKKILDLYDDYIKSINLNAYHRVKTKDFYSHKIYILAEEKEKFLEIIRDFLTENKILLTRDIGERELNYIKKKYLEELEKLSKFEIYNQIPSNLYINEANNHFIYGTAVMSYLDKYNFAKDIFPKIDVIEFNKQLKKIRFDENKLSIDILYPINLGFQIFKNDIMSILSEINSNFPNINSKIKQIEDKSQNEFSFMQKQPKKGHITQEEIISEIDAKIWTLSNGAKVILKKTNDLSNLLFKAASLGGYSLVNTQDLPSALSAVSFIEEIGFGNYNQKQIKDIKEKYNIDGSVNSYISQTEEGIYGYMNPKNLKPIFELIHLAFTDPRKDIDLFNSIKKRKINYYQNKEKREPNYKFYRYFNSLLKGHHPRHIDVLRSSHYDEIDYDKILNIYKERFDNASDFVFVIVGKIDDEKEKQIKDLIEIYIASLPSNSRRENYNDNGIEDENIHKKFYLDYIHLNHTVNIKYLFKNKEVDFEKNANLSMLLAEIINKKITENLRNKGLVYTPSSSGISNTRYNKFGINIKYKTTADKIEISLKEVYDIIEEIKNNGISEDDRAYATNFYKSQIQKAYLVNSYFLSALINAYLNDTDPRMILKLADLLDKITVEDLNNFAKLLFKEDNHSQYILAPNLKSFKKVNGGAKGIKLRDISSLTAQEIIAKSQKAIGFVQKYDNVAWTADLIINGIKYERISADGISIKNDLLFKTNLYQDGYDIEKGDIKILNDIKCIELIFKKEDDLIKKCYDLETSFVVNQVYKNLIIDYRNYLEIDGIKLPQSILIQMDGVHSEFDYKRVILK